MQTGEGNEDITWDPYSEPVNVLEIRFLGFQAEF